MVALVLTVIKSIPGIQAGINIQPMLHFDARPNQYYRCKYGKQKGERAHDVIRVAYTTPPLSPIAVRVAAACNCSQAQKAMTSGRCWLRGPTSSQ